ncbi:hypothetical protein JCM21900_005000 [Sporobolomyces salmonicolor]
MLYIAAAQPATAQLDALKCDFYESQHDVLVLNKLSRLELHSIGERTVELIEEVPVWSGIAAIESVKLPGHSTSSIVVLTTCLRLFVLSYAPDASPKIQTVSSTSIAEPFGRISEYQTIVVDPRLRCLVVHAYDGLLRIVPLTPPTGKPSARSSSTSSSSTSPAFDLSASYNVRISSLNVSSIAALPSPSDDLPALAVVNTDHSGQKVLMTYFVDLDEKDLDAGPLLTETLKDPGSELVIAVPEQQGVLVVGEETLVWYGGDGRAEEGKGKGKAAETRAPVQCRLPLARITSWAFVSETQLLLGDIYGKLLYVEIALASSGALCGLRAVDLGDTTSPTAIVPVSPSTVYLASRFGDSQLVQLPKSLIGGAEGGDAMQQDDDSEEPDLELVASFANLAPIVDCAVVGGEGGAAGYVVTCSGAYKSGSLRVVRRGVGLTTLAALEVEGIQRLWALKGDQDDQLLVLGFFNETRVFRLSATAAADDSGDGEIEEVELPPFAADAATLLAGNLGSVLVQVTANGVGFSTPDGAQHGRWLSGGKGKITTAAIKGEQLVVALEGGQLALLELQNGSLVESSATTLPNDVASVSIATTDSASFVVVGLWASQTVHLLSLPSFETCFTQTLDTTYLIRSVLVTSFADGTSTLFAGLGDGSLTTFAVDLGAKSIDAGSAKTVVLGKKPLLLFEHEQDGGGGGKSVFAVSERLTLVTKPKDRLVYSSVNVEDVLAIAPLSTPAYPSALAIASSTSLRLGRIDALQSQQLDIRTVPLDEDEPRRIAYDAENRTFCVLCSRRDVDRTTGETTTAGSVRLLSEENFSTRATAPLAPSEEGQSLTTVRLGSSSLFAIGTAVLDSGTPEPEKGRLLVLRQPDLDTLEQVASVEIPGCPYALADLGDGFIAAAINSQVAVYSLDPAAGSLSLVATWSGAFIALTLAPGPSSTLVVGDALRSITLLRFSSSPRPQLDELAKDYASRYMVGVEALGGDAHEFLGAETDLNLFTVQRTDEQAAQRSLEDAGTLHPAGAFHLGELVSRFRHGVFGQQYGDRSTGPNAARPEWVYATSAGSIGVMAELDPAASRLLSGLERNLRGVVPGVGGLTQEAFRAYKSNRRTLPSAGFVDGSFVELFLDLAVEEQDAVLAGRSAAERIGVARGEVVRVLEDVARLH